MTSAFRGVMRLGLVGAALVVAACPGSAAPEGPQEGRTAWTTSRVVGSPDPPPPFQVVRVHPNLKFDHPLLIVRYPEADRMVVGEQAGVLYSFVDGPDAKAELFFDLRRELKTLPLLPGAKEVEAVYGLAFHPDFASNRQCFVCYTLRGKDAGRPNLEDGTRVSRFKVTGADPPRIDPASEEIILTFPQGGHNGGDLHFGPDGMLYISTGDAASPNPPDPLNTGQDISDLLSSILRIDVDRKVGGKKYAVPADNPFVALKGARPEVWAYGFRNPWRMSFDRATGDLFVGDVGWELWEMVHRVKKGGNYGWSAMEGPQSIKVDQVGPTPISPPLIELPHSVACSVTGGLVYHGRKFPELRGAYVFGDWETKRLWAARFEGDRVKEMPELTRPSIRHVAFSEDHHGELYLLDYDNGTLHTLERDQGKRNAEFPMRLSDTGLFASTAEHKPASGVVPFLINSKQWLDGATSEHWAAFPGLSSVTLHITPKPIPSLVSWHNFRMHFPKDAVLMRTLSLAGHRVETQLLHFDGVDWRAYSFAWREDQTDADLVPAEGLEKQVRDGEHTRLHQFSSRNQCMSCHSNQSEYALAFLPEQLNRLGPDGRNQLVALTEEGYVRRAGDEGEQLPSFNDASVIKEVKLADPTDEALPLEARARSYLHANCAHCHSDHGGGSVPMRLPFHLPLDRVNAIGVPPTRGDFGLSDARIIKPGAPYASTLYFRMAKFGRDRMPRLDSDRPDEAGLDLIARWIAGLDNTAKVPRNSEMAAAMQRARQLGRGEVHGPERDNLLAVVAKLPNGPTRDLFEGYLPESGKAKKLGSSPRPRAILSLAGDTSRGETLFWAPNNRCGTCHRVGERGKSVGPELTNIGKVRSREELLEALLEPSRRIEPQYATYVVITKEGLSATGLLVKLDEKAIVVRDAEGKEVTVPTENLDQMRPSRASLMPEGQLADLTAQEAADLLAYLASHR